jgi:hypothetical protein
MAFFVRNGGDDGALARGEKRAVHDADGAQLACEHWRDQDGLKESKKEASGAAQTRHAGLLGVGARRRSTRKTVWAPATTSASASTTTEFPTC